MNNYGYNSTSIHVGVEVEGQDANLNCFACPADDVGLIGNTGSEENSSVFSASSSPLTNDQENDSEKSSIVSNSSIDENDDEPHNAEDFRMIIPEDPPLPVSDPPEDVSLEPETNNDSTVKQEAGLKDRKLLSGKLQWLWKFGRNAAGEETSDKECACEAAAKSANRESNDGDTTGSSSSSVEFSNSSSVNSKGDAADQKMMSTLKNLGQSMLENIQVKINLCSHSVLSKMCLKKFERMSLWCPVDLFFFSPLFDLFLEETIFRNLLEMIPQSIETPIY